MRTHATINIHLPKHHSPTLPFTLSSLLTACVPSFIFVFACVCDACSLRNVIEATLVVPGISFNVSASCDINILARPARSPGTLYCPATTKAVRYFPLCCFSGGQVALRVPVAGHDTLMQGQALSDFVVEVGEVPAISGRMHGAFVLGALSYSAVLASSHSCMRRAHSTPKCLLVVDRVHIYFLLSIPCLHCELVPSVVTHARFTHCHARTLAHMQVDNASKHTFKALSIDLIETTIFVCRGSRQCIRHCHPLLHIDFAEPVRPGQARTLLDLRRSGGAACRPGLALPPDVSVCPAVPCRLSVCYQWQVSWAELGVSHAHTYYSQS